MYRHRRGGFVRVGGVKKWGLPLILIPIITMDPLEPLGGRNWPETRSLGHFWAPRARVRVLVECPKFAILTPNSRATRTGARADFLRPSRVRPPAQGIL